MSVKLDLLALKNQSANVEERRLELSVFKSECTQSTAFLLFALNYLEHISGGIGMPDDLEVKVDLGPHRVGSWRSREQIGRSLLRFKREQNRWSLVSSSAAVTYRFSDLMSVLRLILPHLGISGEESVKKVVEAFALMGDDGYANLFAVFSVMPVNSVQMLLIDQTKFARALGISDVDGYAQAAIDWFIVNVVANNISIEIPSAIYEAAVQQRVAADKEGFLRHMKVAYDCRFETALASYADLQFLIPAWKAGLVTVDDLQRQARLHVSQRSPAYIRKLIDIGVDFRAVDAIDALFERAAILPDAKKDAVVTELMDILVGVGCTIPKRSYHLQRETQYPLSDFMKGVVAKHRKALREAEAQVDVGVLA
jgi:hypothetical protein